MISNCALFFLLIGFIIPWGIWLYLVRPWPFVRHRTIIRKNTTPSKYSLIIGNPDPSRVGMYPYSIIPEDQIWKLSTGLGIWMLIMLILYTQVCKKDVPDYLLGNRMLPGS